MRAALVLPLLLLAGCGIFSTDNPPLPGERIPVRQAAPEPVVATQELSAILELGAPRALESWAQTNAIASRAPGHIEGPTGLTQRWRTDIGRGSGSGGRITSGPVAGGGRVFAMDANAQVTAVDAETGRIQWQASLVPDRQRAADGFGGGLALMDGRLFAATGFGEVVALGMADGSVLWRQRVGAPMRAAPAAEDGRVVVVTRDNSAFGLDAETGAFLWTLPGTSAGAPGTLKGASPAISDGVAILPFMSGELVAVRASSGRVLWADALAGGRRGLALASISDVSGDPVIAGVGVFAANLSGQFVAIDGRSGRRGWIRTMGSTNPVWPVGATLFLLDHDARLMRLAAATGETIWATQLDVWADTRRSTAIAYGGPVVAGGRVFVTSSRGELLVFDPATGAETARVSLPGPTSTGPIVVGGTLFVLTDNAVLAAYR